MSYLVQESDGTSKITLEDGTGFLLLELTPTGEGQINVGNMVALKQEDMESFTAMKQDNLGDFNAVDSFNLEEFKVLVDG